MPTRESNAFQRIKERVCRPDDRFDRIENGLAAGTPDCNYCFAGREGWIELKAPYIPARETTALLASGHELSQEQCNWFLRQHRAGGRGFLFVATTDCLMLFPAALVWNYKFINNLTYNQLLEKAIWSAETPVRDVADWAELRRTLTK